LLSLWQRLPTIVRAILAGGVLAALGTVPWALLASANLKVGSTVPWAVPPTLVYLWLYWRYLRGEGWPRSTSQARRTSLRANSLSGDAWASALFGGMLGLGVLVAALAVLNQFVEVPRSSLPDLSRIPFVTLLCLLLTGSVVAGVVEEASFRGYMQGPIERRHGPVLAILMTGILFGVMHFTHREVTLIMMPYYVAVAAVYGTIAHVTNSILPGVVLHAGGNFLLGVGMLARGNEWWQASISMGP
jgi:membrane protease YdiL (CAAX protease family)